MMMPQEDATWKQFAESLSRFVSRRVPPSDSDDVVQEILLRATRNINELRKTEHAEAWLLAIARRVIADYYSKRERSPLKRPVGLDHDLPDEQARRPENLTSYDGGHDVHEEVLSWLRPLAEKINEPYRTALIRADFDKISQRQLAAELGLSDSGLKTRVQRARMMLADVLQRCCEIEFGDQGRAVSFRRLRENCQCE